MPLHRQPSNYIRSAYKWCLVVRKHGNALLLSRN